ncbi:MAG TPA: TetR/AcrR family transcriptional regulator [Hyphomicrobiaceae bacterium]|nr:TetR/AcrR family transcriptional regulator [Hyphomicrobiaceae bacterium]
MPKLKPDTQRARRQHILNAAEVCFARSGFHGCTMQEICKEAGISPGALYVYFASKEDLIAGLAERDRNEFQERFAPIAEASDILNALRAIGEQYFIKEPVHKRLMCVEIGVESTRNKRVGEIFRSVDTHVYASLRKLFERLEQQGRIAPFHDATIVTQLFAVIGDGMMWRRATDPNFNPEKLMSAVVELVGFLLNPTDQDSVHEMTATASPANDDTKSSAATGTSEKINAATTCDDGARS